MKSTGVIVVIINFRAYSFIPKLVYSSFKDVGSLNDHHIFSYFCSCIGSCSGGSLLPFCNLTLYSCLEVFSLKEKPLKSVKLLWYSLAV